MISLAAFLEPIFEKYAKKKRRNISLLEIAPLVDYLEENNHKYYKVFKSLYNIAVHYKEMQRNCKDLAKLNKELGLGLNFHGDYKKITKYYDFTYKDGKLRFSRGRGDKELTMSQLSDEEIIKTVSCKVFFKRTVRNEIR